MSRLDRGFAQWLRGAMERAGIATQADLASAVGVNQSTVSHWMRGAWPRAGQLGALARALGVSRETVEWWAGYDVPDPAGPAFGTVVAETAARDLDPKGLAELAARRLMPLGEQLVADVAVSAGADEWRSVIGHAVLDRFRGERNIWIALVNGACMEPEIGSGDIVLIDRSDLFPRSGSLVAVLTGEGDVLVKRLEQRPDGMALVDNQGVVYRPQSGMMVGRVVFVGRAV